MPVHKCPNGKYRIGSGKCMYDSKAKAERAYKAYLATKHIHEVKEQILAEREEFDEIVRKIRETSIKIKMEIENDDKSI